MRKRTSKKVKRKGKGKWKSGLEGGGEEEG